MVSSMNYVIIVSWLLHQIFYVYSVPLPLTVTDAPKLQGKMLSAGNMAPYPPYQQFPTVGGFPGAYPPMYPPQMGPQYPNIRPYGGNGYVPNYLQQYDMMYSRNRKTFV